MKILFTLLIGFIALTAYSQSAFMKTYPYWFRANGTAVFEEADGYVVAGNGYKQYGYENAMLYLMKVNFDGDTLWTKNFPIDSDNADLLSSVKDASGNVYLTISQTGGNDVFRFDVNWNLTYNGDFGLESPYWISKFDDNNLLVIAWHAGRYVPHKIDPVSFNVIWSGDTISNNIDGRITSIAVNANGEIAIVMNKYNNEFQTIGSTLFYLSATGSILHKTDFEYVLGTTEFEGNNLFSLVYYNHYANFNALVRIQPDGTIISTDSINVKDYSFINFVKDGDALVLAGNYLGNVADYFDVAVGCVKGNQVIWTQHYSDSLTDDYFNPFDIKKTSDNGYIVFGNTSLPGYMPFLLKTGTILGIPEIKTTVKHPAFPNPAGDFVIIPCNSEAGTIELYNSSGMLVSTEPISGKNHQLDVSKLPRGYYVVKVKEGLNVTTMTVIVGE